MPGFLNLGSSTDPRSSNETARNRQVERFFCRLSHVRCRNKICGVPYETRLTRLANETLMRIIFRFVTSEDRSLDRGIVTVQRQITLLACVSLPVVLVAFD